MKKMVIVAMGLMLLAGSGFARPYGGLADSTYAGLPDTAYVGLFADAAHTVNRVNYPGSFFPFTMYIYWLPSKMGMMAAEFKISYPANIIPGAITSNTDITVQLGSLGAGISIAFAEDKCKTDWVYSHSEVCYLNSAVQSQIMVVEHPTTDPPAYQVATCELGYPIRPVKRFTHLSLNYDGGVGVQSKSWGAIKSLF